ncbi:hypothetical protein ACFC18_55590, partial [Streptomyces sp. NPDC056121]|uniref:hypothetical protein n=1 Tax=Streptomyces sp. NPDC056121 TaxID=3345718 RepID=UPI0035D974D1
MFRTKCAARHTGVSSGIRRRTISAPEPPRSHCLSNITRIGPVFTRKSHFMTLFSVVVTALNAQGYLRECLESALN